MKFERLDENKIRCTLTKAELAEMHINLTELAYGTDKAKALFKELMGAVEMRCDIGVNACRALRQGFCLVIANQLVDASDEFLHEPGL